MAYDPRLVAEYIRQAAAQHGIDPDIALRVAKSEGLGEYVGDAGSSFGPYQLHYGGVAKGGNAVGGLGDVFTKKTGLDARNPDTWRQQVDFSLDEAKRGGWGPWHGWKGASTAGIGGGQVGSGASPAPGPAAGGLDRGALMALLSSEMGSPAEKADPVAELLQASAGKKDANPIAGLLSAAQPQETQPDQSEIEREQFLRQIQDFHNAQHMRAVQGLLGA